MLPGEFGAPPSEHRGSWFKSLVLGGEGAMVNSSYVVGESNQTQLTGSLFADFQLGYQRDAHTVAFLAQVDEGVSRIRPQDGGTLPLVKSTDRLRADLLYTWYLVKALGPYARAEAESSAFPTSLLAPDDVFLDLLLADGTVNQQFVQANHVYRVSDAWEPTVVREGAGVNTRLVDSRIASFNWRVGLGFRQNLYGGAFVPADDPLTTDLEYRQVVELLNTVKVELNEGRFHKGNADIIRFVGIKK